MDGVLRSTTYPRKLSLKELDFISEGKGINVAGEESSKSYVGACASLGVYTVLTLACIYYLNQFLDETGPQVQFSNYLDSKASTFRVGSMGTQFYFLLGNPEAKLSIVNATATYDPTKDAGDTYNPEQDPYVDPPQETPGDGSDGVPVPDDPTDGGDPAAGDGSAPDPTPIVRDNKGRRRLQASTNSYLKHSELGKYFNASLRQEILQFGFNGQDDFRIISVIDKKLIPCSEAAWYKDEENRRFMQSNAFLFNLVGKYGICFDVDDKTQIYGDPLSVKSSRLRFTLEYCDSHTIAGCLDSALTLLRNNYGIDIVVGTFEPSIQVSNKSSPWTFDLTSDMRLTLDVLATATVTATMKNITVMTDNGLVIEDVQDESFAVPKQLITQYAPSFEFGGDMATLTGSGLNYDQFAVTYGTRGLTYFDFRMTSSRYNEVYTRTYMTILDLFGNIGGTVEFVIVLFLLLFHWYENVYSQQLIRDELRKRFGLPETFLSPTKKWCCKKHKITQQAAGNETRPLKEIPYHSLAKEALDEIGESALNLERLALHDTTATVLLEALVPKQILLMAPVISLIKRITAAAKAIEQEKSKEKAKEGAKTKSAQPDQPGETEMQHLKPAGTESIEECDLGQAYDWLHQEGLERGIFQPVVQDMKTALHAFADQFKLSDVKTALASATYKSDKIPNTTVQTPFTSLTLGELRHSREDDIIPPVPAIEHQFLAGNISKPTAAKNTEISKSSTNLEPENMPGLQKRVVSMKL